MCKGELKLVQDIIRPKALKCGKVFFFFAVLKYKISLMSCICINAFCLPKFKIYFWFIFMQRFANIVKKSETIILAVLVVNIADVVKKSNFIYGVM